MKIYEEIETIQHHIEFLWYDGGFREAADEVEKLLPHAETDQERHNIAARAATYRAIAEDNK